jgi:cytidylate kinase
MTTRRRSIEQLIEEQAHRWRLREVKPPAEGRRPVITLSRQHGAGGEEIARRLAETLELEAFDREIIQRIAARAQLREQAVRALDERDRAVIDEWLAPFAAERYLTRYDYLHHLIGVVAAIARRGGAIIVGRGGHLLLRAGEALRVMVVAPLEARVAAVADQEGLSPRAARQRIEAVESERDAFLRQYFRAGFNDPSHFDLVVNTAVIGLDAAVATVCGAFTARASRPRPRADPASLLRPRTS